MFYRIKVWLRHYFGFTAKESRGFLVLLGLLFLVLSAPTLYGWLAPAPKPIEFTIKEWKVDSALAVLEKPTTASNVPATLFAFDPNNSTEDEFKQLGLPAFLAKRIVNYRSKGGSFRKKGDLKRIYGMPEALYGQLEPYILLPDSFSRKPFEKEKPTFSKNAAYAKPEAVSIELNTADTAEWKKIRGIGTVLASRIVKFRDRMGGFAQKEQLYEVYGLDSLLVQENWNKWLLNVPAKKILLNTTTEEELGQHPYVGKKIAKVIVNYRSQHGPYKTAKDLEAIVLLDKEKIKKLEPYLSF